VRPQRVARAVGVALCVTLTAAVVAALGWALVDDNNRVNSLRRFGNRCEAAGGVVRYQHVSYDEPVRHAWCWTYDRSRLLDEWKWRT